jgi:cell division protein FtsB
MHGRCRLTRLPNTYRFQARQLSGRAAVRQLPRLAQPANRLWETVARDAFPIIPSWIFLGMILLAAIGICMTVNLRGRAELQSATNQFSRLSSEVDTIRRSNADLQLEVHRITTEPASIESAARSRLGMVKPSEIVVPIQTGARTNLTTLSFIR